VQAGIGEDIEDSQITSLLIALGAAMLLLVAYYGFTVRRPGDRGPHRPARGPGPRAHVRGDGRDFGIPLNPVTATLAALSIGIGVPFTIHVTSRFLEERERGPSMVRGPCDAPSRRPAVRWPGRR
jgi:uncharacterized protein